MLRLKSSSAWANAVWWCMVFTTPFEMISWMQLWVGENIGLRQVLPWIVIPKQRPFQWQIRRWHDAHLEYLCFWISFKLLERQPTISVVVNPTIRQRSHVCHQTGKLLFEGFRGNISNLILFKWLSQTQLSAHISVRQLVFFTVSTGSKQPQEDQGGDHCTLTMKHECNEVSWTQATHTLVLHH